MDTILVVDDAPENIDVMVGILGHDYHIKAAINGARALKLARESAPDLILLDVMMPDMDGYEVCRQLKDDPATRDIPVIFVTAKNDVKDEALGFSLGAVDYIAKPVSPPIVQARVKTQLALYHQNRLLEDKVHQRTRELHDSRLELIRRLGRAAEFKDNETGMHVIRMSHYAHLLARAVGMSRADSELILQASPMHDVGKIGIPEHILCKPSALTPDEWAIMRKHPEMGAQIIGDHDSEVLQMAKAVALAHHERWDGSGYPYGLAGEQIPFAARIVAIADVFDALTTPRPYKPAWSVERALAEIQAQSGKHFEPRLVQAFMNSLSDILAIKEKYGEEKAADNLSLPTRTDLVPERYEVR
jgi:putative two-component system response regulator